MVPKPEVNDLETRRVQEGATLTSGPGKYDIQCIVTEANKQVWEFLTALDPDPFTEVFDWAMIPSSLTVSNRTAIPPADEFVTVLAMLLDISPSLPMSESERIRVYQFLEPYFTPP